MSRWESRQTVGHHLKITFWVLVILKLTGTIDWSWWWVCSPIWAPIALAALLAFGKWLSKGIPGA